MIDVSQLRKYIVFPALQALQLDAAELIILTIAQESLGGTYVHQVNGPALGICQMEPATYLDIWEKYLPNKPEIVHKMLNYLEYSRIPKPEVMVYNMALSVMMARIHYLRVPESLPKMDDVPGLARYWNEHYNCNPNKGTDTEAIQNYLKFTGKMLKGVKSNGKG